MAKGKISLGLLLPTSAHKGTPRFSKILEMAETAEHAGFGSLWVGDSLLRPRIDALITLAAAAARTEKVKLGTATLLLPLRSPVLAAQTISSLDHVSNGRVILGVAPGGEDSKDEFDACGVPFENRGSRMDEQVKILRKLWTENNVNFNGKFYNLPSITLDPKPVQKPSPPVWIGGASERTFKRVAETGDGWLPFDLSPEEYEKNWNQITTLAKAAGRNPSEIHPSVYLYTNLKPQGSKPGAADDFYIGGMHASTLSTHGREQTYTSPDELIKKISVFADIGVRTVILRFAAQDPMGQLNACVKQVVPSL
ncbi:MAG: TIGR03619 family F420-dependent LLM class oxidoreductase [Thaumarchaeota archaeon]|nr:TIGR03619 family F420-dependent LLM class oxidoreductase [Nitrososphaerota archaeon]MCL5317629.1 TIGR03619 family F420-dependent LLM class oxidoreductase [Nitrososphaerota archaeon]